MAFDPKQYKHQWYEKNREKVIQRVEERRKRLRLLKPPRILLSPADLARRAAARTRKYYYKNRERILQKHKEKRQLDNSHERTYYQANKERYAKWREAYRVQTHEWKVRNKSRLSEYNREYSKSHLDSKNEGQKKIYYKKYKSDIFYTLRYALRNRLYQVVKNQNAKKVKRTLELVGCSLEQLKSHLESHFYPHPITGEPMTWENYGKWHIDHRIPIINFDLVNPEQQKSCFHYSNLQPLWAKHNLEKGSKMDWTKK